jgi:oligopeptide transport system ATP-binding protein
MNILEVRDLRVSFPVVGGVLARKIAEVKAVDGVSFDLQQGETLGLVGESGCGKSTVGRAVVNILRAMVYGVEISGSVIYHSAAGPVDLAKLNRDGMRPYRADIQMIFQDPYSSLNPRMTVGQIVEEPLTIHTRLGLQERKERVGWLLSKVGFTREQANRYPHEFSGGQRQRIGIARALATNPKIIIADEPVSALDVSIQAQVVNLMQDLQEEFGLSYVFIAHDLSVVRHISSRIAVMYLGHIVEIGPAERIYNNPLHPYSRALLSAVPRPDPQGTGEGRIRLTGDVPNPIRKPSGCAFRTRCPIARPTCAEGLPPLELKNERFVACPWV